MDSMGDVKEIHWFHSRTIPSLLNGVLQARILEWVAFPLSRDLPNPGVKPMSLTSPALARVLFTTKTTWDVIKYQVLNSLL